MILVCRSIDYYSVPVSNLQQMVATAIFETLVGSKSNSWRSIRHHRDPCLMQTCRNVLAKENQSYLLIISMQNVKTEIRGSVP